MSRRLILLSLLIVQTALLYASTSAFAGRGMLYGCTVFCGTSGQTVVIPAIAAGVGVAMFVLPSFIGAVCRTWQGAVALAVVPWWLAVIAHAGTLLRPYIGLGGVGGRFDPPFWLVLTQLAPLLLSLVLFGLLGWLGWVARRAVSEFAPDVRR